MESQGVAAGSTGVTKNFRAIVTAGATAPDSVDVVYGKHRGMPAVFISDEDMAALAKPFELTLIGKFDVVRPSIPEIRKFVMRLKFYGFVRVDKHDQHNVVFRFSDERDYMRFFARRFYSVFGIEMRVSKWSPFTNVADELPIQPLWISFPGLRYQLFHLKTLMKIAASFGKPLCVDSNTANQGSMCQARVLVEVDVSVNHPKIIWLGSQGKGAPQEVIIEELPLFCASCNKVGHSLGDCAVRAINNFRDGASSSNPTRQWVPKPVEANLRADGIVTADLRPPPVIDCNPPERPPVPNFSNYGPPLLNGLLEAEQRENLEPSPNLLAYPNSVSSVPIKEGSQGEFVEGDTSIISQSEATEDIGPVCKSSDTNASLLVGEVNDGSSVLLLSSDLVNNCKNLVVSSPNANTNGVQGSVELISIVDGTGSGDVVNILPLQQPPTSVVDGSEVQGLDAGHVVAKGAVPAVQASVQVDLEQQLTGDYNKTGIPTPPPPPLLVDSRGNQIIFSHGLKVGVKSSTPPPILSPRKTRSHSKLGGIGLEQDKWSLSKGMGRGNGPRSVALEALFDPKGS